MYGYHNGQTPMHFKNKITNIIEQKLGYTGRLISASKTLYRDRYPKHTVYFNACIFIILPDDKVVQVWWGDVDVTLDKKIIQQIADEANITLYLTPEHPFRGDFYKVTKDKLLNNKYVLIFKPRKH
jgi:hypothetical protein